MNPDREEPLEQLIRKNYFHRMAFVRRSKNVFPAMTPDGGDPLATAYV